MLLIERDSEQKGLAFVMHGLGGFKEQDHINVFSETLRKNNYTVVRFDTTNTLGESGGSYEDATITNYYQDLEDVINWTRKQEWYQEPFILNGHSLGGICTTLYAEKNPEKVRALAPISSVISGELSLKAHEQHDPEELEKWRKTRWRIAESKSKPGVIKKLKWSHMEDRMKYDVLPEVSKLTMPVILIVGENDSTTPPEQQKILFDALPSNKKEIHIISDAPHTFREKEHLSEIKDVFDKWLKSLA